MNHTREHRAWEMLIRRLNYLNTFGGNRSEMEKTTRIVAEIWDDTGHEEEPVTTRCEAVRGGVIHGGIMEFDKSKILTVVTADQAKIGQKGWFASNVETLSRLVLEEQPKELLGVDSNNAVHAFKTVFQNHALFYPAPEPTIRPYTDDELNDLVGEVLTNKKSGCHVLVTRKPKTQGIIMLDGSAVNATQLLENYYRNDNEPCGMEEV